MVDYSSFIAFGYCIYAYFTIYFYRFNMHSGSKQRHAGKFYSYVHTCISKFESSLVEYTYLVVCSSDVRSTYLKSVVCILVFLKEKVLV